MIGLLAPSQYKSIFVQSQSESIFDLKNNSQFEIDND